MIHLQALKYVLTRAVVVGGLLAVGFAAGKWGCQ